MSTRSRRRVPVVRAPGGQKTDCGYAPPPFPPFQNPDILLGMCGRHSERVRVTIDRAFSLKHKWLAPYTQMARLLQCSRSRQQDGRLPRGETHQRRLLDGRVRQLIPVVGLGNFDHLFSVREITMSANLWCLLKPAAVGLLSIGLSPAFAAATYCSSGTNSDGLSVQDVTFQPGTQVTRNSTDCYGVVSGNLTEQTNVEAWSDPEYSWEHLMGTDGAWTAEYETLKFTLSGTGFDDGNSGEWTLMWEDVAPGTPTDLPATLDFVIGLKASDRYALYLFDDILLEPNPDNSGRGEWRITFENNGGQIPGLSHVELFVRGNTVPEPATLLLVACGLVSLASSLRRAS